MCGVWCVVSDDGVGGVGGGEVRKVREGWLVGGGAAVRSSILHGTPRILIAY